MLIMWYILVIMTFTFSISLLLFWFTPTILSQMTNFLTIKHCLLRTFESEVLTCLKIKALPKDSLLAAIVEQSSTVKTGLLLSPMIVRLPQ